MAAGRSWTPGTVLDMPQGSALESAIGTGNLTALPGTALSKDQ
jgi:hypothetical protein